MDATRLLLIRHGETDWNAANRIQGQLDIPLNARGREQARLLAEALAERDPIDHIYSSDLARALQTAQAIGTRLQSPITPMAVLRERAFGAFEGRTFADVRASDPEQSERWRRRDPGWAPPHGETLVRFRDRITRAVTALAQQNPGRQIAVVAHGGVLDVMYRAATGLELPPPRTWKIPNAAVNRVLWTTDSGFTLVGWADTSHLDATLDEGVA
ncbi:MAG: histidine phosphatase family protein [Burkholderiaceae bacterium]|nr:MAG: histidine phosphatase family protein [Burkholderiaceae bacterium]